MIDNDFHLLKNVNETRNEKQILENIGTFISSLFSSSEEKEKVIIKIFNTFYSFESCQIYYSEGTSHVV